MTDRHTDLCKCDWKEKLQAMWVRLQETIKGVRLDGERVQPDGDGIIDLYTGTSRWGAIEGDISDQEDLQAEFLTKQGKLTAGSNISISATNVISATVPGATWGSISGNIDNQEDLKEELDDLADDIETKQPKLTAGTNISISAANVISAANPAWGNITGDLPDQSDLMLTLDGKQPRLTAGTGITIDTDHVIASTVPVVSVSESGTATDAIQYITVGGVQHKIAGGSGGTVEWGDIEGDIDDQEDLQDALDAKQGKLTAGANITITPDNVISASGQIGTTWGLIGGNIDDQLDLSRVLDAKQNILTAGDGIEIDSDTVSCTVPTVSVAETGTATDNIRYITVGGVQHKIAGGSSGASWGSITGEIQDQEDLQIEFATKQPKLTAGTNIQISTDNVISATVPLLRWGNIDGDLNQQADLKEALDDKQGILTAGAGINLTAAGVISSTVPVVSVAETGTATDAIQYITVGGVQHKIAGGSSGATWGSITGEISNQSDLMTQLALKEDKGRLTIAGGSYQIRKTTVDQGETGYITFVIES